MNTQSDTAVQCLKRAGKAFVCRYYDASIGTSAKCLDRAEAEMLSRSGLQIFTVYETDPTSVDYFTRDRGTADGTNATRCARVAGQVPPTPIFFAVDYDASEADLAGPITEYFNGVYAAFAGATPADPVGPFTAGVYGSFRTCTFARAHWPGVPHLWQTYAWSAGQKCDGLDLYQFANGRNECGVQVDLDEAYVDGWAIGGLPVAPMAMTREEVEAIVREYLATTYGPALEAELRTLRSDAVADAVQAVAKKLGSGG